MSKSEEVLYCVYVKHIEQEANRIQISGDSDRTYDFSGIDAFCGKNRKEMADGNLIVFKEKTRNILLSLWKTSDVIFDFSKEFHRDLKGKSW